MNNRIYTINGHDIHTTIRFVNALQDLASFIHPEIAVVLEGQGE